MSLEGQRLRRRSLSFAVKNGDSNSIVGVRPEITDHFLLFTWPCLHHSAFWLLGPPASVMAPGASSGQIDLEESREMMKEETVLSF